MIPTRNQIGTHAGASLATPDSRNGRRKRRPYMPIRMQTGMKQTLHFFFALSALAIAAATAITLRAAPFTFSSTFNVLFPASEFAAAGVTGTSLPTEEQFLNVTRQAAAKGNAEAQAALGVFYLGGSHGLPNDNREGIKWLQKAADAGSAQGQYVLGLQYMTGSGGLAEDMPKAISLFRNAGDQGCLPAQQILGRLYTGSINGAPPDLQESARWYKKAAREHADAHAKAQLFALCCNGTTKPENLAEVTDWCRAAAEAGTAMAQYFLFDAYDIGKAGFPKDEAEAKKWLDKAVAQNDVNVQLCLYARAVENLPRNPAAAVEAVKWLLAAAENKDREGALGPDYFQRIFYANPGPGQADAVTWLTAEAGKKRPWAQFFLGALYAHGLPNLPADETKAQKLFREADEAGLPAQLELVRLYSLGFSSFPSYYLGFANQSPAPAAPRDDDAPAKAQ